MWVVTFLAMAKKPPPMADGDNAKSLKIFGGEIKQYFSVDVILAKCRLVAFKVKHSRPASNVDSRHERPPQSVYRPGHDHIKALPLQRSRLQHGVKSWAAILALGAADEHGRPH